ncbi:hypothetical protein, partial [Aurantimonas coralicida]|uniref:hypothetical protein n=3 Tax=Aurantimonas TaxID=182269 RepID=UPI001969A6A7
REILLKPDPLPARPKPNAQSPVGIAANQCKKIQPAQTSHRNPKTAAVRLKPYTLIPKRDNDRSFSHGCLAIGKETDTKLQANNPPPTLLFLLNLQFSKSTTPNKRWRRAGRDFHPLDPVEDQPFPANSSGCLRRGQNQSEPKGSPAAPSPSMSGL